MQVSFQLISVVLVCLQSEADFRFLQQRQLCPFMNQQYEWDNPYQTERNVQKWKEKKGYDEGGMEKKIERNKHNLQGKEGNEAVEGVTGSE